MQTDVEPFQDSISISFPAVFTPHPSEHVPLPRCLAEGDFHPPRLRDEQGEKTAFTCDQSA